MAAEHTATGLDPAVAQGIATFLGALSTAVLMYASHNWGPSRKRKRRNSDEDDAE